MEKYKVTQNMKEYKKKYYEDNKEILAIKAKIKVKCDLCGFEYSKSCKSHHFKSKLHQLGVATKNEYNKLLKTKINEIQNLLN